MKPHDIYGKYEFHEILNSFRNRGFIVFGEVRNKGTEPIEYAKLLALKVDSLIKSGFKPENISIVGASKGSVIAIITKNRNKI